MLKCLIGGGIADEHIYIGAFPPPVRHLRTIMILKLTFPRPQHSRVLAVPTAGVSRQPHVSEMTVAQLQVCHYSIDSKDSASVFSI